MPHHRTAEGEDLTDRASRQPVPRDLDRGLDDREHESLHPVPVGRQVAVLDGRERRLERGFVREAPEELGHLLRG